jgi:ferritin-like metal-binding protein YciE
LAQSLQQTCHGIRGGLGNHCFTISLKVNAFTYEIAAYGTLCTLAELLGYREAKKLPGQTLKEEKSADNKLSTLAESGINNKAK